MSDTFAEQLPFPEATLEALRRGEVDTLLLPTVRGPQVFTRDGADAFYRVLIEQMPAGAAAVHPNGQIRYANRTFAAMLGIPLETVIGAELGAFARGADRERLLEQLRGDDDQSVDLTLSGPHRSVVVALSVRRVGADETRCVVAVDLTQRRRQERAVRDAESRFRGAFDSAPIGMALLGLDGRAVRVNPALCSLLGRPAEVLLGAPLPWLVGSGQLERLASGAVDELSLEYPATTGGGSKIWASLRLSRLCDADGRLQHYIAQVQDVSERRQYEDQLRFVADHDHLTGLLNRRGFEGAVHEHLARADRYGINGALILLDVDHFKYINDARGHQVGDRVLIALGEALAARLRDSDIVARLGGDEFAVLMPEADARQARTVAEELVRTAREVQITELVGMRQLTISGGVAGVDAAQGSAGQLLALADLALYDAKDTGRDRVEVYDPARETRSLTEHRMTWLRRIQSALDEDAFVLFGQPIVTVDGGETVQHELLIRLPDGNGGHVSAGAWFEVAERYDLATAIDEWVVTRACRLLRDMDDARVGLNVNVSARSIGRSRVLECVAEELLAGAFDPARLTFEITETAAIENIAAAARFVEDLHDLGCRTALDDFGAGFGSFYYLKHLPIDDVKIDGEFVRNSVNDERDRTILRAMVDVAASMGRRTVAECIEDAATLALMRDYGVDLVQGYFLGRPAPV